MKVQTAAVKKAPSVIQDIENQHSEVIIPNKKYVKTLLEKLSDIKGNLGNMEYNHYKNGIQNILNDGDFDDPEEIIESVHELIKKYIYGSDTKVSSSDWNKLEKYIRDAGYSEVPVKAGDIITPYKTYFDRPIPAVGGTSNTIKQIQQKPFIITYEDNGQQEILKLCGKCTYYK